VNEAPEASWQPANEAELAMARAADAGDQSAFFRVLAAAPLYLPQPVDEEPGPQRFLTTSLFGQTFLPVFTSLAALEAEAGELVNGYATTSYAELSRAWPDPQWRLAVNPGTHIDAYLPIDTVRDAAAGDQHLPDALDIVLDSAVGGDVDDGTEPGLDVDAGLLAAASTGDVDAYVEILLHALVLVPTAREVTDAGELLDPGFAWAPVVRGDEPAIEVFTSDAALAAAHPQRPPTISAAVPFVLACWPEGHALEVNPGGPSNVRLPSDLVRWLLAWNEGEGE
jgi:hypothetical protein